MATSLIALALAITTLAVMVRVWKNLWGKRRAERRERPPDRSLLRRWGLSGLTIAAAVGLTVLVEVTHDRLVTSGAGLVVALLLLTVVRQSAIWPAAIQPGEKRRLVTTPGRRRLGYVLTFLLVAGLGVRAYFLGSGVLERVVLLFPLVLGAAFGLILLRRSGY